MYSKASILALGLRPHLLWCCGEPAISLHSHHVSLVQWTTRFRTRDPGLKPLERLVWNQDSPASVVSLHWWPRRDWSFLWPPLRWASSRTITRSRTDNVIIPLDLTQVFCPGFMLAAGLPSGFTANRVGYWGGALWRACNLTSFSPCLTGPLDYLFASRHKGPVFKTSGVLLWDRDSPVSVVSLQCPSWRCWMDLRHLCCLYNFESSLYSAYTTNLRLRKKIRWKLQSFKEKT